MLTFKIIVNRIIQLTSHNIFKSLIPGNSRKYPQKKTPHLLDGTPLAFTRFKMAKVKIFLFCVFNYSGIGTYPHAGTAFNTGLRVNPVVPVKFFNRFCGTDFPAGSADNTVFSNLIFHNSLLWSGAPKAHPPLKC